MIHSIKYQNYRFLMADIVHDFINYEKMHEWSKRKREIHNHRIDLDDREMAVKVCKELYADAMVDEKLQIEQFLFAEMAYTALFDHSDSKVTI